MYPSVAGRCSIRLPRRCVVCGADGAVLCSRCEAGLQRLAGPQCERCGAPTAWPVERCRECAGRRVAFARARAAVAYDDSAKRLVGAWKERGQTSSPRSPRTSWTRAVARPSEHADLRPPADENRLLRRGHNPAQRLAVELVARRQLSFGSHRSGVLPAGARAERPDARGATQERPRRIRSDRPRSQDGRPRRRRLHEWRNGFGGRHGLA